MSIIAQAQAALEAAQRELAEQELQLHQLKAKRNPTRPADVTAWAAWEAAQQEVEGRISQVDLAIRLGRGRLVELHGRLQAAHSRVQDARAQINDAERRIAVHERRVATLRDELAKLETQRPILGAEADERRSELARLLGVPVDALSEALRRLNQPEEVFALNYRPTSEPAPPPTHPAPVRAVYATGQPTQYFDVEGRRVTASGEPL